MEFKAFPKMARWSRDVVVSEKIDGTNACVAIEQVADGAEFGPSCLWHGDGLAMWAGSRTRWVTPGDDHYGFAAWVMSNREELLKLGPGQHFGERWGRDIQRNYSQTERHFSLFNTIRWAEGEQPACCGIVPVLYRGPNHPGLMETYIRLLENEGSRAAPGFMDPEGVVLYHVAGNVGFKKTIERDDEPKGRRPQP